MTTHVNQIALRPIILGFTVLVISGCQPESDVSSKLSEAASACLTPIPDLESMSVRARIALGEQGEVLLIEVSGPDSDASNSSLCAL